MRRILTLLTGVLMLAGLTTACGLQSADDGGGLTIYTARDKGLAEQVVKDFEAKHPEYEGKVRLLTLGAQEAFERVSAEKGRPQADIWWGGTQQQFDLAAEQDLLAPAPAEVRDSVPERYRDAEGRWLGEMVLPEVIFYNKNMLSPEEAPKDWDDLLEPEYENKIAIRDVAASGTMRSIYSAMIARADSVEDGYDWLRKLDANTKVYAANPTDLYLRMQREEASVSVWNLQDVLLQRQNGAPFETVAATSGAPQLVDGVAKVKNGPNGEVADKFLAFLLGEDTQKKLAEEYFQLPTVELAEEPSWLAELELTEMPVDWDLVAAKEKEWISYWSENIKNKH
ncbi:extracellular solute-binding protein [Saccharomonospora sp. NB11]|jgi:iron(III) transport system substrate-binding protein|uniref:extracellular solute-binding protein n=1 Tax=Saccharomonospora sp. NB11 TaxID=1642298 RepID=UPI0018D0264D|nr:extracellular solute-binding protein [Saccharomonospora sp. NB11]